MGAGWEGRRAAGQGDTVGCKSQEEPVRCSSGASNYEDLAVLRIRVGNRGWQSAVSCIRQGTQVGTVYVLAFQVMAQELMAPTGAWDRLQEGRKSWLGCKSVPGKLSLHHC